MADLWSMREFSIAQAPLDEEKRLQEQLCCDDKIHTLDDRGYVWKQTQQEVELSFPQVKLTLEEAKAAQVTIRTRHLKVVAQGEVKFDDDLWDSVRPEDSMWVVGDGILVVSLEKIVREPKELNNWPRCGKSEPDKSGEHQGKLDLDARQTAPHSSVPDRQVPIIKDVFSSSDSDNDSKHNRRSATRRVPTTGTKALRELERKQAVAKEDWRWKKGTPSAVWGDPTFRQASSGAPCSLAEARRRGEV
mmetsp:Transcript_44279/g.117410  ORF Transcript_44279/g.117410 Transcript_44279/m.117410 type:complete len:247 (-) Transcript_44279:50-790(-)